MSSPLTHEQNENVLTLSKEFDTTKDVLFSMFANQDQLQKWWGPTGWPATIKSFDFRPGGVWHYYMQGPDGTQAWGKATYEDIDEPNTITYIDAFSDEDGNDDPNLPKGHVTLNFVEEDGKTNLKMTVRYDTAAQVDEVIKMGMIEGITDTTTQLEKLVASA